MPSVKGAIQAMNSTELAATSRMRIQLHLLLTTQEDPPPQIQRVNRKIQEPNLPIQTTLQSHPTTINQIQQQDPVGIEAQAPETMRTPKHQTPAKTMTAQEPRQLAAATGM